MNLIELAIQILINSFLLAKLANLGMTRMVFRQEFGKIQNWIGVVCLIGLSLNYVLFFKDLLLSEAYALETVYDFKEWDKHTGLNLMFLYPLVLIALNLTYKLRTNKIVAILSLLMFVPRLLEFSIVYFTSDVTFKTMNSVFTDPMLQILIAGPVLYGLLVLKENVAQKKFKPTKVRP